MRQKVLAWCQSFWLVVHPGMAKTKEICLCWFWWDKIGLDIQVFVTSCPVCAVNKASHTPPAGLLLLLPLLVPPSPWHTISIDFVTDRSLEEGYTSVLVVVDLFTKMAHVVPLSKVPSARELADVFIAQVLWMHGVPTAIVSDRGAQFVSHFWRELCASLKMELWLSSAYHLQSDGHMERTNQTMEQYIRCLMSSLTSSWLKALPIAEFAYNKSVHSDIRMSPFFCSMGFHYKAI